MRPFQLLAFILLTSSFSLANQTSKAIAVLVDAQGKEVGKANLRQKKNGVEISLRVKGIPEGVHAFHIHENGKCEAPEFKSAGGHFNPSAKKHGLSNPEGHHHGDMPNIRVKHSTHWETFKIVNKDVTLMKGKPNSLLKEGGTSLVIHASEDDLKSEPAGNAGPRIACGVVSF
jgi:Cu-Zn family superoxide dismutase